ncbi:uncharacterized protein B0I36DRAFT_329265 [Microdochium trichocladiopsis]|uniref:Secreted protein n=1 Tax=Microdochium trichocladiopsis TaxID=1682393 RepID=A0A9P8XZ90_9PEZI|nr:uncharacterized protein B0I36DRAFT_329265 [Microdochium trichocladiopsis]KAH7025848.1 hypothetical protein B0I36DRAFT_329265 [Microdochium trichocladiopsis]
MAFFSFFFPSQGLGFCGFLFLMSEVCDVHANTRTPVYIYIWACSRYVASDSRVTWPRISTCLGQRGRSVAAATPSRFAVRAALCFPVWSNPPGCFCVCVCV